MAFTAADVKKLREMTSVGMMECKKALTEADGDFDKAIELLREKGVVRDEEVIEINIPAGVAGGMQLTVQGKGNAAPRGGVNGDLLVLVEEEEHKDFVRDGSDLIYNLLLDMPTAVLGGQVQIPTLTGNVKITITPGTQPGKVLRMRGKMINVLA